MSQCRSGWRGNKIPRVSCKLSTACVSTLSKIFVNIKWCKNLCSPFTATHHTPDKCCDCNHNHKWCYSDIEHAPLWKTMFGRQKKSCNCVETYLNRRCLIMWCTWWLQYSNLTTVAFCISKLDSDEVLHPERVADTAACVCITLAVTRAVQLTDCRWKWEESAARETSVWAEHISYPQCRTQAHRRCTNDKNKTKEVCFTEARDEYRWRESDLQRQLKNLGDLTLIFNCLQALACTTIFANSSSLNFTKISFSLVCLLKTVFMWYLLTVSTRRAL